MLNKLKQAYPKQLNSWKIALIISSFIGLFIFIFQPFGLQMVSTPHKSLKLLGYGMVTFFILFFNLILLPKLFKKHFDEDNWTLLKQIVWLMWILFNIGVLNYLYSIFTGILSWVGFEGFLYFIVFTSLVGLIPIAAISFIRQNHILRQNINSSDKINKQILNTQEKEIDSSSQISISSGNKIYTFNPFQVAFIEAEGNYVNVVSQLDGEIQSILIRNTLKNIQESFNYEHLFKCHRAFIVNLNFIEKVSGNSQGYTLELKNTTKQLPVSRSYIKTFKERFLNQQ